MRCNTGISNRRDGEGVCGVFVCQIACGIIRVSSEKWLGVLSLATCYAVDRTCACESDTVSFDNMGCGVEYDGAACARVLSFLRCMD